MQIPVVIETVCAGLFRVEAPPPFSVSAEGASPEEALERLRGRIAEEFANGRRIVALEVTLPDENSWMRFAGHLKDDTFLNDFQTALAEYRRQRDPHDE